jgi:hypothetical protein
MDSAKKKPKTIDEYLANVKPGHRRTLQKLRQTIQTAVPKAGNASVTGFPLFASTDVYWFSLARGPIIARFIQVVPPR